MRILVVEDDTALNHLLARTLREESYAVDTATDGQEGEWLAFENPYDLIVLDLMLPVKDGIQVLKSLRAGGVTTPVLILTAKDSKEEIVQGLDAGADDYLTKPFSIDELLARARVLFRRPPVVAHAVLTAGPLSIDPARKEATFSNNRLDLTTKEYALLEYFVRNSGTVLSRTQLSEHVWDMNFEPASNVVDVYVGYLRNKIDRAFNTNLIKTVRGFGYMLDADDQATDHSKLGTGGKKRDENSAHVS